LPLKVAHHKVGCAIGFKEIIDANNSRIILFRYPGQDPSLFKKLLQSKFKGLIVFIGTWTNTVSIGTSHCIGTRHVFLYSHAMSKIFINRKVGDAKSTSAKHPAYAIFAVE